MTRTALVPPSRISGSAGERSFVQCVLIVNINVRAETAGLLEYARVKKTVSKLRGVSPYRSG